MIPVNSSNLEAVEYDFLHHRLLVLFHEGRLYEYLGVPHDVYRGLMAAQSKGHYLYEYIRNRYSYRRLR